MTSSNGSNNYQYIGTIPPYHFVFDFRKVSAGNNFSVMSRKKGTKKWCFLESFTLVLYIVNRDFYSSKLNKKCVNSKTTTKYKRQLYKKLWWHKTLHNTNNKTKRKKKTKIIYQCIFKSLFLCREYHFTSAFES